MVAWQAFYEFRHEDELLSDHRIAFERWITLEDESEGWQKPKQLVRRLLDEVASVVATRLNIREPVKLKRRKKGVLSESFD